MTSVFDGMAGVLNGVFGAPVTIHPGGGGGVEIRGVIRDREVEVPDGDGQVVLGTFTTLKAQVGDVTGLVRGNAVSQGARSWTVDYRLPSESPAADRFETFVLKDA